MTITVDHNCDTPGCFKHSIQHDAPKEQIEALIQLSASCQQSIDFGCYLAPLEYEGTSLGWWLDKSGIAINKLSS